MTEELGETERLAGRVALATGTSKGIGAARVRRLGKAGTNVAVGFGGDRETAEGLASEFEDGGRWDVAVSGDVSNPARIPEMVSEVEDALGPVNVLVPNAGVAMRQGFEEVALEYWYKTMDVNLRAAFLFAQRVAPGMRERGRGRIVFVSSVAAFTGGIIGPHYTVSKAALIGLAHAGEPAGPARDDRKRRRSGPHRADRHDPRHIRRDGGPDGPGPGRKARAARIGRGRDPHGRRQPLRHGPDRLHGRRALPPLRNRDRKHEER